VARIAFALELGAALGHVKACSALAQPLALRGHRIAFIMSPLHAPENLAGGERFEVFRARGSPGTPPPVMPASYAEVMLPLGYRDAATLAPLAESWRAPLEAWKPDLLVADFAPTAMLAARALGIPRVNYGSGFTIPPRLSPLPSFRFDEVVPAERVARADAQAAEAASSVSRAWGGRPLASFADLLECDEEFLCTFPELDSYGVRPASGYWGPRFLTSAGARVSWPARGGKRVLVYMKRDYIHLDGLIDVLAGSSLRVALFVEGLEPARRSRLEGPTRRVSDTPIRLDSLLDECELVVSHGGELTTGTLARGVPQLVLPLQYEQYINARRVEQLGAGRWLAPTAAKKDVSDALVALLSEAAFTKAARAFAGRYPSFSPVEQRRRMVARIEQLARGGPILAASPRQGKPE
jgi:UDP:flavonoid glycosyltransferase YjiC (YdhE family)